MAATPQREALVQNGRSRTKSGMALQSGRDDCSGDCNGGQQKKDSPFDESFSVRMRGLEPPQPCDY